MDTPRELTRHNIDPRLIAQVGRRRDDIDQTMAVMKAKVRVMSVSATDVGIQTDVNQLRELANELRGEVELFIEQFGHMVDQNL